VSFRQTVVRGLAATLGVVLLLDVARRMFGLGDNWWLDLRGLPTALVQPLRLGVAILLIALAARPRPAVGRRLATMAAAALVVAASLRDAVVCARLSFTGWFPLSLALAMLAAVVLVSLRRPVASPERGLERWLVVGVAGLAAVALTLGQMVCYGASDYRRQADAVVVLGARTYASGRPSLALADRVRTGCELVMAGHAKRLVLSGGPGDGATHETSAMRRLALDCGVPSEAITLDTRGVDTRHSALNTRSILGAHARVLAVSHDYHLPRVKLAFSQAGLTTFTVPATETRTLLKLPYFMLREVAAFWSYYLGDFLAVVR
jgi:uncharacterized SAM-binding protein YcdF (DUF218 family)